MSFHDSAIFPSKLGYGSSGGAGFKTQIFETDNGNEVRIRRWEYPRHRYTINLGTRTEEDLHTLKKFFVARDGAKYGFRFFDPADHSTASDGIGAPGLLDSILGTGDGATTEYQFVKQYSDGGSTRSRILNKLIAGTDKVAVDGVLQVRDTNYTIDESTGIVTFVTAPASGTISGGVEFHVPARFGADTDNLLSVTWSSFGARSADVELYEIKTDIPVAEALRLGGYADQCADGSVIALQPGSARVQTVDPDGAAVEFRLPDVADLLPGGPHFYVINTGTTGTLAVKDSAGNDFSPVLSLSAGEGVVAVIGVDGSATKQWYLLGA